jgi:hypothetical protein
MVMRTHITLAQKDVVVYFVKAICHYKDKEMLIVHHTTFKIKKQSPGNTCGFFVCISMSAFGSQLNCDVSVSAFILLYY